MNKAWRVIIFIVLIAILLGAVCIGVGLITGADTERIYTVLDDRYMITDWSKWCYESLSRLLDAVFPGEAGDVIVMTD